MPNSRAIHPAPAFATPLPLNLFPMDLAWRNALPGKTESMDCAKTRLVTKSTSVATRQEPASVIQMLSI